MGQKQSQAETSTRSYAKMFDTFSYKPETSYRTEATYNAKFQNDYYYYNNENNDSNFREKQKTSCISPASAAKLINVPHCGICMMMTNENKQCPEPRIGQCFNYDEDTNSLIIAYGKNQSNKYFNDIWSLSLSNFHWRLISENLSNPRSHASSILIGRKMLVFGGTFESRFYDDLISIDVDSGEIYSYKVKSPIKPSPRVSPAFFALNHHVYLFGGDDNRSSSGIYRLKFDSINDIINQNFLVEWKRSSKGEIDVKFPVFCLHNGDAYVFDGTKENSLMIFDRKKRKLQPICCSGVDLPPNIRYASIVSADEFLFLIGGENNAKYMHIFANDIKRKRWFVFNVRPDNETLLLSDGIINKNGQFMLPREHSASAIYLSKKREIISVMGSKFLKNSPVFRLKIGDALSSIHLRSDMLDMMQMEF